MSKQSLNKFKQRLIKEILNLYEDFYLYTNEELIDAYFHLQDEDINHLKKLKRKLIDDNLSEMKHYFL